MDGTWSISLRPGCLGMCFRAAGVLRMAMNWLSDCKSGKSLYVSRQASLHSYLVPEYWPPEHNCRTAFTPSLVLYFHTLNIVLYLKVSEAQKKLWSWGASHTPAHIFRTPILSQFLLYAIREIGKPGPHKLRRVTSSEGWDPGPKNAQVRLEGRRVVLLNSSQEGESWNDHCTRAYMMIW